MSTGISKMRIKPYPPVRKRAHVESVSPEEKLKKISIIPLNSQTCKEIVAYLHNESKQNLTNLLVPEKLNCLKTLLEKIDDELIEREANSFLTSEDKLTKDSGCIDQLKEIYKALLNDLIQKEDFDTIEKLLPTYSYQDHSNVLKSCITDLKIIEKIMTKIEAGTDPSKWLNHMKNLLSQVEYDWDKNKLLSLIEIIIPKQNGKLEKENEGFIANLTSLMLGNLQDKSSDLSLSMSVCEIFRQCSYHPNGVNLTFKPHLLRGLIECSMRKLKQLKSYAPNVIDATIEGPNQCWHFNYQQYSHNPEISILHNDCYKLNDAIKGLLWLRDNQVELDDEGHLKHELDIYGSNQILKSLTSEINEFERNQTQFSFSHFTKEEFDTYANSFKSQLEERVKDK